MVGLEKKNFFLSFFYQTKLHSCHVDNNFEMLRCMFIRFMRFTEKKIIF